MWAGRMPQTGPVGWGRLLIGFCDWVDVVDSQRTMTLSLMDFQIYEGAWQVESSHGSPYVPPAGILRPGLIGIEERGNLFGRPRN